jgi:hypothetical protein
VSPRATLSAMANPRAALTLTVLALLALLLVPSVALGDGDPASDVLLGENVYYPYQPPVPRSLQKTLNAETAAAAKDGNPIKVAVIASPIDLGVIPDLFDKPQKYADFLDQEISFRIKQPLLVVMPAGYGVRAMGGGATAAAAKLPPPAGKSSAELADAAITAVSKLSAADGHPISGVPGVPGAAAPGGSSSVPLIAGLGVAAVAVAAALIVLRRRQATAR